MQSAGQSGVHVLIHCAALSPSICLLGPLSLKQWTRALLLKEWLTDRQHQHRAGMVRNAESRASPLTHWIRICILIGPQVIPVHVQIGKALDSIVLRYPPNSAYRSSWKVALETIMKKAPGLLLLASENSYLVVGKALNWERSSRLNPGVGLGSGVAERFLQPLKFQRQVVCQEWLCFQDAHPLPFPEGSFSTNPSRTGCHFSSSVQVQTGQDRSFCLATRRPRLTGPKWPEVLPTPQASSECPSLPVTARCVSVEGNHCL